MKRPRRFVLRSMMFAGPLVLAGSALAQETLPEGHSAHGEAFNEGPRQAAYLMPNPGNVHFPVTSEHPEVQAFFDQGVGQLHGFWYFEAERTFRQVAALDPDCAMAYWGMAMANVDNAERAASFARVAWLKRGLVTPREGMYIDAIARFHEVEGPEEPGGAGDPEEPEADARPGTEEGATSGTGAAQGEKRRATEKEEKARAEKERAARKKRAERLVKDYEEIVWDYPDDIEAKAFLVNRIWLNRRLGIPITSRQANEALLQQVFAVQPDHPAHHYRIHLWDAKDSAERVVDTALASGPSWPSVAHMWHMGGHIFARLGRHTDAAWQQEASARVDHAQMIRDQLLPDQIFNFAHNNEWLTRSMRHHGRVREATALAKNMIELPRHPEYNHLAKSYCSATYGRRRLLETLELFEQWDELVELSRSMYLAPSEVAKDRGQRAYLLGKAHAYLGHDEGVVEQLEALEALVEEERQARAEDLASAEDEALAQDRSPEDVLGAMQDVLTEHREDLQDLRDWRESLEVLQDVLAAPFPGEELEQQVDLLDEKGFDGAHLAQLCLASGLVERAVELAREAVEDREGQLYYHATLAHVLYAAGETEEALEVFDELRQWSARADLDLPVFTRLQPLAAARDLPADWRVPDVPADDVRGRPDLEPLGPLRWTPPLAKAWTCPDGFGNEVSLADYAGRPVLVIFFLGFKCVHCVEQLNAFAPAADEFAAAGIEIVTIGTNSVEQLTASLDTPVLPADDVVSTPAEAAQDTAENGFPFPILSNAECDVFRRYRAYDDFEQAPLHGTFLVDARGRIRWLDISYEPFMDWEFLLAESRRLLGLSSELESRAPAGASRPGRDAGPSGSPVR